MSEPTNQFFKGEAWACFFLRMWIGMRLMFAGLTKFLTENDDGKWKFDTEKPEVIMGSITETMKANTAIPEVMLGQYATVLPWASVSLPSSNI